MGQSKFSGKPIECGRCGKVFANRYAISTKEHISKCNIESIDNWVALEKDCQCFVDANPLLYD